ncbi:transposable element Tcb2 transposase [Trichonephila clavipes]|nr:transposable element Tcb2 transposase [Trichonephila clavipes]
MLSSPLVDAPISKSLRKGVLTGSRYRGEILKSVAKPYAVAIGYDFRLMDDDYRTYRANLIDALLLEKGITIWNRFLDTGSAGRRPGQGLRWATTPNEDRYLVLTARRHRNMNATFLQQHLRSATGTTVSTQTV